jgi:hypothetical protein
MSSRNDTTGTTGSVYSDPLAADHAEAKTKVGQRVMALQEAHVSTCPLGVVGHVIAVELPVIYCGGPEGNEQLADPTLFIEWVGKGEVTPLSLEEYRVGIQEV